MGETQVTPTDISTEDLLKIIGYKDVELRICAQKNANLINTIRLTEAEVVRLRGLLEDKDKPAPPG